MDALEQPVLARLTELGIPFTRYEHPAVFTVEQAREHWAAIPGLHCKNLFLTNRKGSRYFLVVMEASKQADLQAVSTQLGDGRLRFASPERLLAQLGLTPGSVSPFGVVNNATHDVHVALDEDLAGAELVAFHPNINTATLTLAFGDLLRFLQACANPVSYVKV